MNEARAPAVAVYGNGGLIPGIIDVEVSSNNHLAANRFRLTASLSASGYGAWTAEVLTIDIRIELAGAWASLIYGEVDQLDIDVGRGEVRVDGRDLTSRFIEARTQESFDNRTASDVASTLAARHGLAATVAPTTTLIGRDFQNGHSRTTLSQHARSTTEWDLLIQLAEAEGFDVWVDGQTLFFMPPDQATSGIFITPADCRSLRLQRLLTLSGGIEVTVRSWGCRGQRSVVQTASTRGAAAAPRAYSVVRPNLNDSDAQLEARRLLTQMAQHERSIVIEMPGDLTTHPRDVLTLTDTNTDFDGLWMITGVEREVSFHRGFIQTLEARTPSWTAF